LVTQLEDRVVHGRKTGDRGTGLDAVIETCQGHVVGDGQASLMQCLRCPDRCQIITGHHRSEGMVGLQDTMHGTITPLCGVSTVGCEIGVCGKAVRVHEAQVGPQPVPAIPLGTVLVAGNECDLAVTMAQQVLQDLLHAALVIGYDRRPLLPTAGKNQRVTFSLEPAEEGLHLL